jgi:hypothetical protein
VLDSGSYTPFRSCNLFPSLERAPGGQYPCYVDIGWSNDAIVTALPGYLAEEGGPGR